MTKKRSVSKFKSSFKKSRTKRNNTLTKKDKRDIFPKLEDLPKYMTPGSLRYWIQRTFPEKYPIYIKNEETDRMIRRRYDELVNFFSEKMDENGMMDVYRAVKADDISDVDIYGVGEFWSYEKDWAISYYGEEPFLEEEGGEFRFVITAKVKGKDVNWYETFEKNFF
jgi:hypothetical protein